MTTTALILSMISLTLVSSTDCYVSLVDKVGVAHSCVYHDHTIFEVFDW